MRCVFLRHRRRTACSDLFELVPSLPRPTPAQYLALCRRMLSRSRRSLLPQWSSFRVQNPAPIVLVFAWFESSPAAHVPGKLYALSLPASVPFQ